MVQELNGIPGEVDLLVFGAGAAGLTAALTGATLGLQVVLVEKTDKVGGTSAFSAGSVWVPNTRHSPPGQDDFDNALTYLRQAVGNRLDETRAAAFLREGPAMVDFLEDSAGIRLRAYPYHPDYLATLEGATTSGRVLEPVPFDARVLGQRFREIRPPLPEFTLFGGMMVDRTDIGHLMAANRSPASLLHALRLVARYGLDRLRYPRGTRLVMGNALIGRLYNALLQQGATVLLSTGAESLITNDRAVSGAVLTSGGTRRSIQARAGVVLATGGFSRNPDLRRQFIPDVLETASPLVDSVTGDGVALAKTVDGQLGQQHQSNSFWAPVSRRQRRDGSTAVFPHFVLDRGKPGAIAVDPDGRRFVNEATSYHRFGEAMIAALKGSGRDCCYLLCDDAFIEKYGLGMVRPRRLGLRDALRDGYIVAAETLAELADKIGVPAAPLAATVERHNGFAESGVDSDFGKGEDAYQRNLGDPSHGPNPCLGAMVRPPFYALAILPGDIGASVGLVTDETARVVDSAGVPIRGLYACGNDMESIMAGHYPGPGITLGPGMTFGYVAAVHAASMASDSEQE